MTVEEEKRKLRAEIRHLVYRLMSVERHDSDRAITCNVLASEAYQNASCVFAYYGVRNEIDTRPLLFRILTDGKRLLLPRVKRDRYMEAVEIRSLAELEEDFYGIMSPPPSAPAVNKEEIPLILVPCLAATREGFRLGQGGGYYDSYLSDYKGTSLLLVRERFVLPTIPLEPHDVPCTGLITEQGEYRS